uniref:Uncharacterized protein n=1 Tax=Ditylum brightwellii TaxID=49249 RepID=A0A7S4QZG5_9STRA
MVRHDLFLVPLFALTLSVFQPFYLADALEYIPEHIEECVYKQIDHVDNFVDCKYSNTEDNVCQRNFKKLWKKLTRSRQGKAPVCSKEYPPSDPIISVVEACKSASFREQQCDKLTDAFLGLAHGDIDKDVCEDDKIRCPDGSYVGRNPKNYCKFYDCPVEKCRDTKKYCWDGSTIADTLIVRTVVTRKSTALMDLMSTRIPGL